MSERLRAAHPFARLSGAGLLSSLVTAVFAGTLVVLLSVSFAALIFAGDMSGYIPQGIALAISASIIVGLGFALFSHCSPTISLADEDTAPVDALLASLVIAAMPAGSSPAEMFASALAAILLSTIVAGCGLALLGAFKFGSLVQYLPYSVMGGYFAAVGWLLLMGGIRVATNVEITSIADGLRVFDGHPLWGWLPLTGLTALLLFVGRRFESSLLLPATILVVIPAWYGLAVALGYSPSQLMQSGALVGPFTAEPTIPLRPLAGLEFASIHWPAVFSNLGLIGAIFLISVLSMVVGISGLGLLSREELDMDRELKIAGFSNIASGLGGGMTGLPSYSLSRLAIDMGAPRNPRIGVMTVLICAMVFVFGLDLAAYTPRFIPGALLAYIGIGFLHEWLVAAWHKFSRLEYLVIPIILTIAVSVGFLEGMLVGLTAAVIIFVVKYSQTQVIRFSATGAEVRSNVDRSSAAEAFIRGEGERMVVLGLQGYLFFGTAGHVYEALANRARDVARMPLSYAVLDFSQVTGLDASAALNFQKMALLASKAGFKLVIAGLEPALLDRLIKGGFEEDHRDCVMVRADLDRAIEWCEEDLLASANDSAEFASCFDRLRPYLASDAEMEVFKGFLERREIEAGTALTRQGDESRELFFIEAGAASAFITDANGEQHRVRQTRQGSVYGEMGFYLGNPRTATVVTDEPATVYVLSLESLAAMESQHSEIAGALHRYMANIVCERLRFTTQSLRAVLV